MKRLTTFLSTFGAALGLLALLGFASNAVAQSKPLAGDGLTIVVPFLPVAGKSREEVVGAMKKVVAVIHGQPGLIDDVLMEAKSSAKYPGFVHVARWRARKDWDAVFTNPDVIRAMKANAAYFSLDAAGVYTQVEN